jgi:putative endonuclease
MWHLYLVRTRTGDLYTGIATNVARRMAEHELSSARAAKYLRGRGPLELAFQRPIGDHVLALQVERRVKRLSRRDKERMIESDPETGRLLEMLGLAEGPGRHEGVRP